MAHAQLMLAAAISKVKKDLKNEKEWVQYVGRNRFFINEMVPLINFYFS